MECQPRLATNSAPESVLEITISKKRGLRLFLEGSRLGGGTTRSTRVVASCAHEIGQVTEMSQTIAGFSIRSLQIDPDSSDSRRGSFLLRSDIPIPKSVDTNVWAEVCKAMQSVGNIKFPLPTWSSRFEMLSKSLYSKSDPNSCEVVLTVLAENQIPDYVAFGQFEPPTMSLQDWIFLGFDVADAGLISGLSNCEYSEPELLEYRRHFLEHLNEQGLFQSVEPALEFASMCNRREPNHAPFFVFGIYADKAKRCDVFAAQ